MAMETTHNKQNLDFQVFFGDTYIEMSKLISAGFVPASAAQIMQGRLDGKLDYNSFFASGDVSISHPDGRVKLVHDSEHLRRLTPFEFSSDPREWDKIWVTATEVTIYANHPDLRRLPQEKSYGLILPDWDAWESLEGRVFSRDEIERYVDKQQSKDAVKSNPFWQWLARDDLDLLREYADQMFSHIEARHAKYNIEAGYVKYTIHDAMRVGIAKHNPKVPFPRIHLWNLGGIESTAGRGNALSVYYLVFGSCTNTLVGVKVPDAPREGTT